jgi:hypothetical protein
MRGPESLSCCGTGPTKRTTAERVAGWHCYPAIKWSRDAEAIQSSDPATLFCQHSMWAEHEKILSLSFYQEDISLDMHNRCCPKSEPIPKATSNTFTLSRLWLQNTDDKGTGMVASSIPFKRRTTALSFATSILSPANQHLLSERMRRLTMGLPLQALSVLEPTPWQLGWGSERAHTYSV